MQKILAESKNISMGYLYEVKGNFQASTYLGDVAQKEWMDIAQISKLNMHTPKQLRFIDYYSIFHLNCAINLTIAWHFANAYEYSEPVEWKG